MGSISVCMVMSVWLQNLRGVYSLKALGGYLVSSYRLNKPNLKDTTMLRYFSGCNHLSRLAPSKGSASPSNLRAYGSHSLHRVKDSAIATVGAARNVLARAASSSGGPPKFGAIKDSFETLGQVQAALRSAGLVSYSAVVVLDTFGCCLECRLATQLTLTHTCISITIDQQHAHRVAWLT